MIHSQLVVSRKLLWWNLENFFFTTKFLCHIGLLQRFPSKIIGRKNWIQKHLEAARTPNESNQNQKPSCQELGDPWVNNSHPGDRKMSCLVAKAPNTQQERGDPWMDQNPSRVVCQCQTRAERPVGGEQFTQLEKIDIDFRVPGLSHAVVKEAEIFRVQELVKKIEGHPHREAQADLQQNNVYNPFGNNSKEMIRELGNVELFELCETTPKVQCAECLLYLNQGIVCCTCGQCLIDSECRRKFNKLRQDALSIPHNVIKKGRCHGARHAKLKNRKSTIRFSMRAAKELGEHFKGFHERFPRDPVYRESQLLIGWTEQKCIEMDELAKQNHTYHLSSKEFKRYQGQWYLTLNKSGKNAPMRLRPDCRAAVSRKKPCTSWIRWGACRTNISTARQEMALFLKRFLMKHVQKLVELMIFFKWPLFCYSWFRLQSMAITRNRRGVHTDTPHTSFFSCTLRACTSVHTHHLAQDEPRLKCLHARVSPSSYHPWWAVEHLFLVVSSFWLSPCISPSPCFSLSTSTCALSWTSSSMWTTPRQTLLAPPPIEESCSLAEFTPPTGHEPKLLDDVHNSESTEMIFQDESGDIVTEPAYSCDAELDDEIVGKALSSPLFIQERGESADRRQAYHSYEESLLPAQSLSNTQERGDPCTNLVR